MVSLCDDNRESKSKEIWRSNGVPTTTNIKFYMQKWLMNSVEWECSEKNPCQKLSSKSFSKMILSKETVKVQTEHLCTSQWPIGVESLSFVQAFIWSGILIDSRKSAFNLKCCFTSKNRMLCAGIDSLIGYNLLVYKRHKRQEEEKNTFELRSRILISWEKNIYDCMLKWYSIE